VVVQTIHVGSGPTGVALGAGDVWVADTLDGTVDRIDPGTSQVVQRIAVGSSPTELAVGAGSVWVVNSGDATVSRIDPQDGRVLATTDVGPGPSGLAVAFGSVWVAQRGPGAVARLDARSGRLRQDIHVGSGPFAIAADPGGVWVTNQLDSTVSRIDPVRGAVTLTRAVAGTPAGLAAIGGRLYVASRDLPVLTEIGRGAAIREVRLPSPVSAVVAGGGRLLVGINGNGVDHRGGTLRVRSSWALSLPDTHGCCDVPPFLRNASYDGLLAYSTAPGSTGVLIPDLAMAVPLAEDKGRTYTFTLRPGLRYWTGRPVRASDVRRGLEVAARSSPIAFGLRSLRGASACPSPHAACDLSAAVTSNDRARTITFHLSGRDPELLYQLASSRLAPAPSLREPVPGTGPYRIARIVPGRLIDLERNPYYRPWAPAAQPPGFPDRILWETGRNPVEGVRAVLAGTADYSFDSPTPEQATFIRLHAPGQLHVEPVAGVQFAFLNTRVPPFDDVRARRALNFATDRRAIARRVGVGTGKPLCQVIPSTILGHLPYCPYTRNPVSSGRWSGPDLRRARALVAASGTRGMRITYYAGADQPDTMVSDREIARTLRRLGYRVRFRVLSGERWFRTVSDPRRHAQIGTGDIWADYPSASPWLVFGLGCKTFDPGNPSRTFNDAEFCDATVDRWARRAIQLETSDPAAAGRLWARTDRRVTDLAPWVPVIQPSEVDFVSSRVGNYRYLPTIGLLLQRLWVH
jgi:ABC-type transport system substrate-binding protein